MHCIYIFFSNAHGGYRRRRESVQHRQGKKIMIYLKIAICMSIIIGNRCMIEYNAERYVLEHRQRRKKNTHTIQRWTGPKLVLFYTQQNNHISKMYNSHSLQSYSAWLCVCVSVLLWSIRLSQFQRCTKCSQASEKIEWCVFSFSLSI